MNCVGPCIGFEVSRFKKKMKFFVEKLAENGF